MASALAVRDSDEDEADFGGHHKTGEHFAEMPCEPGKPVHVAREKRGIAAMQISCDATDKAMMTCCIELSRIAVSKGEYPFGTVIALAGQIVAEGMNSTIRDRHVTRHAEIIVLSHAQKTVGREQIGAAGWHVV